ncbi:proteasome-type protease [Bordetella genomosp. 11]|uniref:Peptidase n=1 Tax=Bordetella genomosp. 11 TaxID=1416808 RepID=A0A261UM18_9BORD|nr:proteasome-type protease [Bordetella genomosp. 11]OZI62924.1 peptidase [Bordetella genomosp. 11]
MTYCVAAHLHEGLVFLADSRTNAGVDQISVFRKLNVFERPGERVMVLMTSGNLAISQSIMTMLSMHDSADPGSIWNAPNMFEATRIVGEAIREVHRRDAEALHEQGVEFNVTLIFGGQIGRERCRLFQVYAAGNFIEAHAECPYFQIGESKYGKPILDRVLEPGTTLDEAAKCALISMDSTLRSNISVGLPLDLLVYEADTLRVTRFANIDENNAYFRMIRNSWGEKLRQVFAEIDDPAWTNPASPDSLVPAGRTHQPVRVLPGSCEPTDVAPVQALAEGRDPSQRS